MLNKWFSFIDINSWRVVPFKNSRKWSQCYFPGFTILIYPGWWGARCGRKWLYQIVGSVYMNSHVPPPLTCWYLYPSKREALSRFWLIVGPSSTTLTQHWNDIRSIYRVLWDIGACMGGGGDFNHMLWQRGSRQAPNITQFWVKAVPAS